MRKLSRVALGFSAFAVSGYVSLGAQAAAPAVLIPDSPRCVECRISSRVIATLGPKNGDGALDGQPFEVMVDERNRYWVTSYRRAPMLYDSSGKFLRALGAVGEGPGEYRLLPITRFVGGDSTLVIDLGTLRFTMYTRDLAVARTLAIASPGMLTGLVPVGRTLFGASYLEAPEHAGFPLHMVPIDGVSPRITRSFGGPRAMKGPRPDDRMWALKLAPGLNNTLWSADIKQYRIEHWSAAGAPLRQLLRKPEWFKDTSRASPISARTPPDPVMQTLAQDTQGLLWVAVLVASPTWQEGWGLLPRPPGGGAVAMEPDAGRMNYLKMYMTNLEVLDPAAGRLVATFSVKETLVSLLPGRRAAIYSEDADGFPVLQIVQLTLSGR